MRMVIKMTFKDNMNINIDYIEKRIRECLPTEEGLQKIIIEAMNYSVLAGGKRIRPMLMLETYRMFGGKASIVNPYMAAIEMIHTYSLVHDDLPAMDNDEYRRGQLTTHKKFGEDMGILAGDGLLNFAYEVMFKAMDQVKPEYVSNCIKAARVIAEKSGIYGMVGGQTLDVYLTNKPMTKEHLDFIFRLKTGALIEASMMAGAYLAGADEKNVDTIEQVAAKVGLAFQIKDDILDVTSSQEVLGKPIHSDEKNNKTTYVSLYGMDKAVADVERYSKEAIELLKSTGNNEFLEQLIDYLINRNN